MLENLHEKIQSAHSKAYWSETLIKFSEVRISRNRWETTGGHNRPFARSCQEPIQGRFRKGTHGKDKKQCRNLNHQLGKDFGSTIFHLLVVEEAKEFNSYLLIAKY